MKPVNIDLEDAYPLCVHLRPLSLPSTRDLIQDHDEFQLSQVALGFASVLWDLERGSGIGG